MVHRREDYADTGERAWLDRPDATKAIARRLEAREITAGQAAVLREFEERGCVVLEDVFDHRLALEIVADIERVREASRNEPIDLAKRRFENTFSWSDATRRGMLDPTVLSWLDLILGMRVLPHQSLTWPISSQIGPHSDSILMTSHPRDHFIAAWFALEDLAPDCGPVYGIPGSHRWPYVSASDVGIPVDATAEEYSRVYDARYYAHMERVVAERDVAPYTFVGKQGDVMIWHSNLIHGAHLIERADAERMCMIVHYYGEGCEPYSDLFRRPCTIPAVR